MFHTHSLAISIVFALAILSGSRPAQADDATDTVRRTISKSLPFIEREGVKWIEEKKCVTCHQVPFMVWSLNAAKARGLPVDNEKLAEWNAWATDYIHFSAPAAKPETLKREDVLGRNIDTMAQLLLGRAGPAPKDVPDHWQPLFRESLVRVQQATGMWAPCGQLPGQKRPERETQEVTTMWSLLALSGQYDSNQPLPPEVEKGLAWLGTQTRGKSTEWWAMRLLLERALGHTAETDRLRSELLSRQHDDGGWGWLCDDESDALGTGMALYALARDGVGKERPALSKARDFLCRTQMENGSWSVKGTKKSKEDSVEATAVYWGTCWAVIGLAERLD